MAVDHYHVIFTVPPELLPLWRYNPSGFAEALFHAVNDTLMRLSQDEKHLGALPGMILSLHTWGRNLESASAHSCLITGGGLGGDGRWRHTLYRGKLLAALRQGLHTGELRLPPGSSEAAQRHTINAVARKKWNVCIRPPYRHGRGVMGYLARYVKGGPLSDCHITAADRQRVSFRYQDHRDGKHKL